MNLTCLFPEKIWCTKLSPARRHAIQALARTIAEAGGEVTLTGQGWPGWDNARRAVDNIDDRTGAVLWYKWQGSIKDGVSPIIGPREVSKRWLTIETYNEAWWPDDLASRQVIDSGTRLVICHHWNDMPRFDLAKRETGCKVVHIPHAAEASIFSKAYRPWDERDIDVLLTGTINPEVYPLRSRFARLIAEGKMPGNAVHYPHPGCRVADLATADAKVAEYAAMLGRSKVALVCGSIHNYALAKYFEAAMAGCCVVGSRPAQRLDVPLHYIVNDYDSDAQICDFVTRLLLCGQSIAVSGSTPQSFYGYALRLLVLLEKILKKEK